MIVEKREYRIRPGKEAEFITLYEKEGWGIQSRILGSCVGYYIVDIGYISGLLHLWAYRDFDDRTARRTELGRDAGWSRFLDRAVPLLDAMTSEILRPAPFFRTSLERIRGIMAHGAAEHPSSQG